MFRYTLTTRLGDLLLIGSGGALSAIHLPGRHAPPAGAVEQAAPFAAPIAQLDEYFEGRRTSFELELAPSGGAFDLAVWERVAAIPYGQTRSYGQVARDVGHPDSARAVGASNGRNPLPIVVPCHRVIGSTGRLVGYGGGLDTKRRLLELESGGVQQQLA